VGKELREEHPWSQHWWSRPLNSLPTMIHAVGRFVQCQLVSNCEMQVVPCRGDQRRSCDDPTARRRPPRELGWQKGVSSFAYRPLPGSTVGSHLPSTRYAPPSADQGGMVSPTATSGSLPNEPNGKRQGLTPIGACCMIPGPRFPLCRDRSDKLGSQHRRITEGGERSWWVSSRTPPPEGQQVIRRRARST
jgi:hypothetical protein